MPNRDADSKLKMGAGALKLLAPKGKWSGVPQTIETPAIVA
jgi:hypothetical protein